MRIHLWIDPAVLGCKAASPPRQPFAAAKSKMVVVVPGLVHPLNMPARVVSAVVGVGLATFLLSFVRFARDIDVKECAPLELTVNVPVGIKPSHDLGDVAMLIEDPEARPAARERTRRFGVGPAGFPGGSGGVRITVRTFCIGRFVGV